MRASFSPVAVAFCVGAFGVGGLSAAPAHATPSARADFVRFCAGVSSTDSAEGFPLTVIGDFGPSTLPGGGAVFVEQTAFGVVGETAGVFDLGRGPVDFGPLDETLAFQAGVETSTSSTGVRLVGGAQCIFQAGIRLDLILTAFDVLNPEEVGTADVTFHLDLDGGLAVGEPSAALAHSAFGIDVVSGGAPVGFLLIRLDDQGNLDLPAGFNSVDGSSPPFFAHEIAGRASFPGQIGYGPGVAETVSLVFYSESATFGAGPGETVFVSGSASASSLETLTMTVASGDPDIEVRTRAPELGAAVRALTAMAALAVLARGRRR